MDHRLTISVTAAAVIAVASSLAVSSARAQSSNGTEYHEVEEGDTLYDLSGRYFGDSKRWPELWSYNPHITNPHWIYPGDIVYLSSPTQKQAAEAKKAKTDLEKKSGRKEQVEGLKLAKVGFIAKERPTFVGRIVASPKEGRLLGKFDSAWVGFGEEAFGVEEAPQSDPPDEIKLEDPGKVQKGSRFAIVQQVGQVENEEGDEIGYKYLVMGSLVVTKKSKKKLETALIDQSWHEIQRGAYLVPYDKQVKLIERQKASTNLVAEIVASLSGHRNFAQSHYVFINKGASDGVRPGNRLYIYQREAGLSFRWKGEKAPDEIPWQRIGHIRVVDTTENFATAIVVSSKSEIQVGDRLEMYKGD